MRRCFNQKYAQIGSEDTNDVLRVGQRVCWKTEGSNSFIQVDQQRYIEKLGEIQLDTCLPNTDLCATTRSCGSAGATSKRFNSAYKDVPEIMAAQERTRGQQASLGHKPVQSALGMGVERRVGEDRALIGHQPDTKQR